MTHRKLLITALAVFTLTLVSEGSWMQWAGAFNRNGEILEASLRSAQSWTIKQPDTEPVTLVAFGDLMLGRYVWQLMEKNGHDYPFEHFPELLGEMLSDPANQTPAPIPKPDFIFANLEGPISDNPYVNPGTAMVFNFKPAVLDTLKKFGFNLLNLANNHAYDMGEDGMRQTRQYLTDAGIHHFGDAKGLRPETTWTTTVKDTTLTFFGLNDTLKNRLDFDEVNDRIRVAEDTADFTIVTIHWGTEYQHEPNQKQIEAAHAMVDAGADLIIGHHPHVIQSNEIYHGAPIYYSLGNFIFDQYFQQDVQEGLGLAVTLKKSLDPRVPDTLEVKETVFDIVKSQAKVRAF